MSNTESIYSRGNGNSFSDVILTSYTTVPTVHVLTGSSHRSAQVSYLPPTFSPRRPPEPVPVLRPVRVPARGGGGVVGGLPGGRRQGRGRGALHCIDSIEAGMAC